MEMNKTVERKAVTISDLINECNAAATTMSVKNPHRMLIINCAYALKQMADRLYEYEHPEGESVPESESPVPPEKVN